MPRTLHLDQAFWTLGGGLALKDEAGTPVCAARGGFSWIAPTWSVERDGRTVATVRQKILAWRPAWLVDGELGAFTIRRRRRASEREYEVVGGHFDGARMTREPHEQTLRVTLQNGDIARVQANEIEMVRADADTTLLVAIALVARQMDRLADATQR